MHDEFLIDQISKIRRHIIHRDWFRSNSVGELLRPFIFFVDGERSQVDKKIRPDATEGVADAGDAEEGDSQQHEHDVLEGDDDEGREAEREDVGLDVGMTRDGCEFDAAGTLRILEGPNHGFEL